MFVTKSSGSKGKEMFYLRTHSTHFIYSYMVSDIWLRTILIVRKETRCRHIGYSFLKTARVLLYAPSHRQDSTYHGLCYTSRGALAGTRNSSMGPPHEGSIRRPIAPWANALTTELHLAPLRFELWITLTYIVLFQILEITRQILALYEMWKSYDEKKEIQQVLAKMPKAKLNPSR